MNTARTIFGDVQPGDWVIAAGNSDYGYLLGTVTAIDKLGTPEHDSTDNDTDDIHVDFTAFDYPPDRVAEIEETFTELYGEQKIFDELPLDDVIMAPDELISISNLSSDEIERMGNLRANCEAFCDCFPGGGRPHSEKHADFIERVNKNLTDYHDSLEGFGSRELIDMADKIAAMSGVHSYLCYRGFEDDELNFLLQFQNPLEVVADAWYEYNAYSDNEMDFAFDGVVSHKQDWLDNYPLMKDYDEYADTSLRRYMGVDLELYLGKIAEKVIIHHPDDWKTDLEKLHKAADSDDPEEKRLMWQVCSWGTHLNTERETFIRDTGAYTAWVHYHERDPDMFGYAVEVTGRDGGIITGDIFEVGDYYLHSLHVKENAHVLDMVSITYSDEWGVNAGKTICVPRYEYNDDRKRLMCDSGNVTAIQYYPYEGVKSMSETLRRERAIRMALPIASAGLLLRKMADKLAEVREPADELHQPAKLKQTLTEKLQAASEKAKAQGAPNNKNIQPGKRAERE
jgi:hypothetical protein